MARQLKVPSLQHMARIWRPEPEAIKNILVRLMTHGPTFSYAPLFKIVHGMLVFKTSYDVSLDTVGRIKREDVRNNFLELMPLIRDHFREVNPSYVNEVVPRLYSLSRDIQIPFAPPFVYGVDGTVVFPWLSFWKRNPLENESLSMFVTIVEEMILQDSDLEEAQFQILDFSAPDGKASRHLKVLPASKVPRVEPKRKAEMLSIFAEGYRLARKHFESIALDNEESVVEQHNEDQMPLF